jgi:DNA-binding NtrC family response regulator
LFLDEIGDMSANVQAKLLRALEERRIERLGGDESIPVDVRIVSATHRALEEEIDNGNFRADLFYRLRVVTVEIAPLRERREDIPLLAAAFARQAAERHGLPERALGRDALRQLMENDWPGNVRELKNVIERAAIMSEGDELNAIDLGKQQSSKASVAIEGINERQSAGSLHQRFSRRPPRVRASLTSLVVWKKPTATSPGQRRFWGCTDNRCNIS